MEREPDTDTTLVDLLYGEVEESRRGEAEARVAADVELAGELERMRALRGALRSWHTETEAEPSGGIDDLLAAARAQAAKAQPVRAAAAEPPRSPGLWERLHRWMAPLLAHPGMAAAATLVLVVGVAGTLYLTSGSQLAEPTAGRVAVEDTPEEALGPPPAAPMAPAPPGSDVATAEAPKEESAAPGPATIRERAAAPAKKARVVDKVARDKRQYDEGGAIGGLVGGTAAADEKRAPEAKGAAKPKAEPPPPPPAPAASAPVQAPSPAPAPESASENESADLNDSSTRGEAVELLREARIAARRGDCAVVRKLSARVREIDAAYYNRTFRVDRDVAACLAKK
jgi:hypothetical protein